MILLKPSQAFNASNPSFSQALTTQRFLDSTPEKRMLFNEGYSSSEKYVSQLKAFLEATNEKKLAEISVFKTFKALNPSKIQNSITFLDIGFGNAELTSAIIKCLTHEYPSKKLFCKGIDLSKNLTDKANTISKQLEASHPQVKVNFETGNYFKTSMNQANGYDLILCSHSLYNNVEGLESNLLKIVSDLSPNGIGIFIHNLGKSDIEKLINKHDSTRSGREFSKDLKTTLNRLHVPNEEMTINATISFPENYRAIFSKIQNNLPLKPDEVKVKHLLEFLIGKDLLSMSSSQRSSLLEDVMARLSKQNGKLYAPTSILLVTRQRMPQETVEQLKSSLIKAL
jgi:SAM-dependent methyltransferase